MHIAALNGDYKVIKLLLLYSANPFIKNNLGSYPIDYAKLTNHMKSYNVLLSYHHRSSKNLSSIAHSISPVGNQSFLYEKSDSAPQRNRKSLYFKAESKFKAAKLLQHQSCIALPCLFDISDEGKEKEHSSLEKKRGSRQFIDRRVLDKGMKAFQKRNKPKCDSTIQFYDMETEECTSSPKQLNCALLNQAQDKKPLFNEEEKDISYPRDHSSNNISFVQGISLMDKLSNRENYPSSNNHINHNESNTCINQSSSKKVEISNKQELQQQEASSIYLLLKDIRMEQHSSLFANEGFDDINILLSFLKQKTSRSFLPCILKAIKPGDRARIQIKLQELSNGFNFELPSSVYYHTTLPYEDSYSNPHSIILNNWLSKLKMEKHLKHIFNAGYHSLELLLIQMGSSCSPLTEDDLLSHFKVSTIGHRTRLMNQLIEDSIILITQLRRNSIEMTERKSTLDYNCGCSIY